MSVRLVQLRHWISSTPLACCGFLAPDVLVVAPSNAPFNTIQAAVDAANPGDTVLVRAGVYDGFTVDGQSVSVVANLPQVVSLTTPTYVSNLSSAQRVVVSGFSFAAAYQGGLRVDNCAGSVRLEALSALPPTTPDTLLHAVVVESSSDVAVFRCALTGGTPSLSSIGTPGVGLNVLDSRVAVYDSQLTGGNGTWAWYLGSATIIPAQAGGAGCLVEGASTLFASGSSFAGGTGGSGASGNCFSFLGGSPGAPGGAGLSVVAPASVSLLDCTRSGGSGGAGGPGVASCGVPPGAAGPTGANIVGVATLLPGQRRVFSCPTVVRELNNLDLTFHGQPGDLVWTGRATDTSWGFSPALLGVRLVSNVLGRTFHGAIPASGTLTVSVPMPALPLGVESETRHYQALFRNIVGQSYLSSAQVVVVLDAAF
jgi:hypothetical protein